MFVLEIQLKTADLSQKGKKIRPKSSVVSFNSKSFMCLGSIGVSYILCEGTVV